MNIKSLNIKNFRNYAIASVSLCDGINLVKNIINIFLFLIKINFLNFLIFLKIL